MKNKLFLALALAGAVACKKDKPAEPSTESDVNAQVTEFINKLDLTKDLATQVQEFSGKLKNDTEMEKILVGGARANNVWELEKFTGTVIVNESDIRDFSWDISLTAEDIKDEPTSYLVYSKNYGTDLKFYNSYKFNPSDNGGKGFYYTNNGTIDLNYKKECELLDNKEENVVTNFFYDSYQDIKSYGWTTEKGKEKLNELTSTLNKQNICYEYVMVTTQSFGKTDNTKKIKHQKTTKIIKAVLNYPSGRQTYKTEYALSSDVYYNAK